MSLNEEGYVVRIRGLPWSCTQEEVASFFSGENIHTVLQKLTLKYQKTDHNIITVHCHISQETSVSWRPFRIIK